MIARDFATKSAELTTRLQHGRSSRFQTPKLRAYRALGVNSSNSVGRLPEERDYLREIPEWLTAPRYSRALRLYRAVNRLHRCPAGKLQFAWWKTTPFSYHN